MNHIRFANKYREPLLTGEKTVTVRLADEHEAEVGKIHELLDENDEQFGVGYVPHITTTNAKDAISIIDKLGLRHGADTPPELIWTLRGFYHDKVNVMSLVDIIPVSVTEVNGL